MAHKNDSISVSVAYLGPLIRALAGLQSEVDRGRIRVQLHVAVGRRLPSVPQQLASPYGGSLRACKQAE